MGASCLTGIITCQIKKENPTKTLSEFCLDSHVARPFATSPLSYLTARVKLFCDQELPGFLDASALVDREIQELPIRKIYPRRTQQAA